MVPEGWSEAKVRDLPGANERPVTKLGPFGSSLKKSDYSTRGFKVYGQQQVLAGDEHFGDYWIDEEKYCQLQACSVEPGDILLSTMGSFGSVLRLTESCSPGIINPRLLRLSISPEVAAPEFLEVYLKSSSAERQFLRFAQGGTMPAVNGASIGGLTIPLPPLPEQRKIAEILSTWDRAIETTEALLANARTQKRALMQSLLTGKRRFPEFEGQEWRELPFERVFRTANDKKTQVNKRDYQQQGSVPVVDQGKEFIVGYTDSTLIYEDVPVIVFGDHTRELKWVDFPFCPGADGTQLLKTQPGVEIVFGYHLLQDLELPNLGYSRHMRELKKAVFNVPQNEDEQRRISGVLQNAESEISTLKQSVRRFHDEKKALMQQLLTGKRRVVLP